jgi:hypothetical protein
MENLRSYKWLFVWSACLIVLVLALKTIQMSKPVVQLVGVFELLLAILTGIAFGWKASKRDG